MPLGFKEVSDTHETESKFNGNASMRGADEADKARQQLRNQKN